MLTSLRNTHLPRLNKLNLWLKISSIFQMRVLMNTYIDEDGNVRVNPDVIARSRLRVDTRKWYASKLAPKIYGDKGKEKEDEAASASLMQKLIDKL